MSSPDTHTPGPAPAFAAPTFATPIFAAPIFAAPIFAAPIFAALGDRTRLSLLVKLSDGQTQSIVRLAGDTRLTRQAVTKHLRVLEKAGLVSSIRVGRESQFTYNAEPIARAKSFLDTVSAQWDDALSRLRGFVER